MLPIDSVLPDIIGQWHQHACMILRAAPGAGKTTRVPLALWRAGLLGEGQLVMLEPRRVAARAAAEFMAAPLQAPVGQTVGYRMRHERRDSAATRILVMTEGVLTGRFRNDPFLEGVSVVVLDEFHERSVHLDLCLAFLRELQLVRDDLKLLVMSATLDVAPLSRWLGDCPVIDAPGRMFPVAVRYDEREDARPLAQRAAAAAQEMLGHTDGDVLVFLPGAAEIHRTLDALRPVSAREGVALLPLYSALPQAAQDVAIRPATQRRIIAATNIAETSLTLPGVTAVVDSGLQRRVRFDPAIGFDRLELAPISRWSAEQRAGRAGRIAEGQVRRLWMQAVDRGKPASELPEIRRVDATWAILQILQFSQRDPALFDMFDPIPPALAASGVAVLRALEAVAQDSFALTATGRRLLELPMHPRLGAIVIGALDAGCLSLGLWVAALLEEGEVLATEVPPNAVDAVPCDVAVRLSLLEGFAKEGATPQAAERHGLRFGAARRVYQTHQSWLRLFSAAETATCDAGVSTGRLLLAGYPDRVCARRAAGSGEHGVMVGGSGVQLDARSAAHAAPFFVAVRADGGQRGQHSRSRVSMASAIAASDLQAVFPGQVHQRTVAVFDREKRAVLGHTQQLFGDLVLSSQSGAALSDEAALSVLLAEAADAVARIYHPSDEALAFMARLRYAAREMPHLDWPDVEVPAQLQRLPHLALGMRSFDELAKIDWLPPLRDALTPAQKSALSRDFPESVAVPSGSRVRIDYAEALQPGRTPLVAVRLQEVFGLQETPRIAQGRIPLTFSLLAPNMRPLQITQDLASFWRNTYPSVRAELRGRYVRHHWPEDPLLAVPTRRAKPRR